MAPLYLAEIQNTRLVDDDPGRESRGPERKRFNAAARRRRVLRLFADVFASVLCGRRSVAPTFGFPDLSALRLARTCRRHDSTVVGAIVVDIAVVVCVFPRRTGFSVEDKTGESRKQEDLGDAGHVDSP